MLQTEQSLARPRELDPRTAPKPNIFRMRVISSPSKLRLIRITAFDLRKVNGAGKHALMPEAVDLRPRFFAEENRRDAFFCDHFKAPCPPKDPQQRPDDARHNRQHDALNHCESWAVFAVHSVDSTSWETKHSPQAFASCIFE